MECVDMNPEFDYKEKAEELFNSGYNCAQAVLCAFSDVTGLPLSDSLKISSSFGGGMGRLREVCGAVSAMFMIVGIRYGYTDMADKSAKDNHYKLIQEMADKFKEKTGSIICREILNNPAGADSHVSSDRTEEYYAKRPCARCVYLAAKIVEDTIRMKG